MNKRNSKPVNVCTPEGEELQFPSLTEAIRNFGWSTHVKNYRQPDRLIKGFYYKGYFIKRA